MRRSWTSLLLVGSLTLTGALRPLVARAETGQERWDKLPEERKEELRANYRSYQAMNPQEKRQTEENFRRLQALPKEKRERVIRNYRRFEAMPPERRQEILRRHEEFKKLPKHVQAARLRKATGQHAPTPSKHPSARGPGGRPR